MNLTLPRETLLEPLQLVIGVVERRQTMPILANVLLTADGDTLSFTATDLEIELIGRASLPTPTAQRLQMTVAGRKLLDICRSLPEKTDIHLQLEHDRLLLKSGRSRFQLATLPVENFPAFDEGQIHLEFPIHQDTLTTLLQRTHFAMAQQDVRYYLNGMLLEVKENHVRTVASDGHRFALHSASTPLANPPLSQIILPRKGVLELLRLLKNEIGEAAATIGESHVRIHTDTFTFTSKLIDARFPDYERVLPRASGQSIVLDRDDLREALTRATILSGEKLRVAQLRLNDNVLHILANNAEQEEAEETLPIEYTGPTLDVAFNATYLLDVLNIIAPGDVKLTFVDGGSRMFMEEMNNDHSLFLIMPLQL